MLTLMSFNLRYGRADDGVNRWAARRALAMARVRERAPDLLALQECEDGAQAAYVKQALGEYAFIGFRRGGVSETAAEMAPVLYRRALFEQEAAGRFWLSATPDVAGSLGWGAQFPRTLTWARLRRRATGEALVFASTHFDLVADAILASAHLVADWARAAEADAPVIVAGDFNAARGSAAHAALADSGHLRDTLRAAPEQIRDEGTYHAFGTQADPTSIDWILASPRFAVKEAGIDRFSRDGVYPSDHYPVWAVVAET